MTESVTQSIQALSLRKTVTHAGTGGKNLHELFKSDPASLTTLLRDTWASVCAPSPSDSDNILLETIDSFAQLAKDLYNVTNDCEEDRAGFGLDDWSALHDAGLFDLIQDILTDDRFFSAEQRAVPAAHMFHTYCILSYPNDEWGRLYGSRALRRSEALWTTFWHHRRRIAEWPLDDYIQKTGNHPVVQILVTHSILRSVAEKSVPRSSCMNYYALHAWATASFPTQDFKHIFFCAIGQDPWNDKSLFIREGVIDGVGIDPCMTRLAAVLRGEEPWRWTSLNDLRCAMTLFSGLTHDDSESTPETSRMVVSAGQHGIPHLVVSIVKKHALAHGLSANPAFYNGAFTLLSMSIRHDYLSRHSAEADGALVISGEDVAIILSCAIELLALHGAESEPSDGTRKAMISVVNFLSPVLQSYYKWIKEIKSSAPDSVSPLESELLAGLKRGAADHWWPSLRRLDLAKHQCEGRNEHIVQFSMLWKGFGALLGCDAKQERQRDAQQAAGRCARLACEYNRKPSETQLLRCKGCGVYYCSRDCQVADWKSGHKRECRRLDSDHSASRASDG
ncbi:unnamed protein product [Peniophora sp. CBMAI 1063]|nr:unnamed protein product [Peniophora sp. CBMAI 1063]